LPIVIFNDPHFVIHFYIRIAWVIALIPRLIFKVAKLF
jgi:hypothetical protein